MMKTEPSGIKQERSSVFVVVRVLDGGVFNKRVNIAEIPARVGCRYRSGTGAGILLLHGRFDFEIPGPSLFSFNPKGVGFPSELPRFSNCRVFLGPLCTAMNVEIL